jgi:hypothetical protein
MRVALSEIAQTEERETDDLVIDLTWLRYDKLHVRRDAPASALRMADAMDLHRALYDVVVAAARAAESDEPRATFAGRRPVTVEGYLDQVRLIPSVPGSFVVRALLPLSHPPEQEPLPLVGPAAPAIRMISWTIMSAARAAVSTAREVALGVSARAWDDIVDRGVSSNLCDALSRLPGPVGEGPGEDVTLRIDWTWAAPDEPISPVEIPAALAPVLAAGGDYLRGTPEEHSIRMTGLITKLHREAATGPGEITVRGHVEQWDSSSRALRMQLDEPTYREAIGAHEEGRSVRVVALVRRSLRGLEVLRVEDLQILA